MISQGSLKFNNMITFACGFLLGVCLSGAIMILVIGIIDK